MFRLDSTLDLHDEEAGDSGSIDSRNLTTSLTSSTDQPTTTASQLTRSSPYDFSRANVRVAPEAKDALDLKEFTIRRAESPFETTITITKNHIMNVFEKIHSKYNMKKNELKRIVIEYTLPLANGKMKTLFVENDDDKEENLISFYCKMEELSPYPLIIHTKKSLGRRGLRPAEKIYQALVVNNFSADLNFYEMFVDNIDVAEKFKNTRDYVSLIMGVKCMNLLSPAHFYCHIKGCGKVIITGYFSKLSLVVRHWEKHSVAEYDVGPGSDMARRYRYIEKVKGGKKWLMLGDFESRLEELNNTIHNEKKLTITEGSYNYIDKDSKFSGRSFLINEDILDAILNCDYEALASLPKPKPPGSIKSYFSSPPSSSTCSSSTKKSAQKKSSTPISSSTSSLSTLTSTSSVSLTSSTSAFSTSTSASIKSSCKSLTSSSDTNEKKKKKKKNEPESSSATTAIELKKIKKEKKRDSSIRFSVERSEKGAKKQKSTKRIKRPGDSDDDASVF